MRISVLIRAALGSTLALAAVIGAGATAAAQPAQLPLIVDSARITIAGTSNVHDYTATTSNTRVTRVQFAGDSTSPTFWEDLTKPASLEAFDIAIVAGSLTSPKEGIDKNMHKALKVKQHADITFSLKRMEGAAGAFKAFGTLTIAGVERDVVLPVSTTRKGGSLTVIGTLDILMTDFGITPPKALLGMVRTDPKVTVTFELVLAIPTT